MGIRGELFTKQIHVENRTYFFNVKENRMGDVFLQIVESKSTDGNGFDRHAIVVFEEEMQTFLQGLNESLEFVEKNRKERLKKQHTIKVRKEASDSPSSDRKKQESAYKKNTEPKKTPKKVRIVSKMPE
ncbi:MAG: PUR family DNA/RNA-binding protein [Treponema sp.]